MWTGTHSLWKEEDTGTQMTQGYVYWITSLSMRWNNIQKGQAHKRPPYQNQENKTKTWRRYNPYIKIIKTKTKIIAAKRGFKNPDNLKVIFIALHCIALSESGLLGWFEWMWASVSFMLGAQPLDIKSPKLKPIQCDISVPVSCY